MRATSHIHGTLTSMETPRYRAVIWVEGEKTHFLAHLWTVPRVGETMHLEQSEMFLVVTGVMHYVNAVDYLQGWPNGMPEQEAHLKINAKHVR